MYSLAVYLRGLSESRIYDKIDITSKYAAWLLDNRYMILCHEREQRVSDAGVYEYVAAKCAKRGNDIYASRVESRLRGLGFHIPNMDFDIKKRLYTNILFITLTYDTKLCSFVVAWKSIGVEFNRWRANIRKKYGEFSIFRCFEAFENGHPHNTWMLFLKRSVSEFSKSLKTAEIERCVGFG